MKNKYIIAIVGSVLSVTLHADITFGSRDSVIILNGSSFSSNGALLADGSFRDLTGGALTLSDTQCSGLAIEQYDSDRTEMQKMIIDSESYTAGDSLLLASEQKLTLAGGNCYEEVSVGGDNCAPSIIEGFGSFSSPITVLGDAALSLRWAQQLNQNIVFTGTTGDTTTVVLEQNLSFAPGSFFDTDLSRIDEGSFPTTQLVCNNCRVFMGGDACNTTTIPDNIFVEQGAFTLTGPVTLANNATMILYWRAEIEGAGKEFIFGNSNSALRSDPNEDARVILSNVNFKNVSINSFAGGGHWDMTHCSLESEGQILEVNGSVTGGDEYQISFDSYTDYGFPLDDNADFYYAPTVQGPVDVFGTGGATFAQSPTGEATLVLHADVTVQGQWKFADDFTIIGNGFNLNVSEGMLKVANGKVLKLEGVTLVGVNSNSLLYEQIQTPTQTVFAAEGTYTTVTLQKVTAYPTYSTQEVHTGGTVVLDGETAVTQQVLVSAEEYTTFEINGAPFTVIKTPAVYQTQVVTTGGYPVYDGYGHIATQRVLVSSTVTSPTAVSAVASNGAGGHLYPVYFSQYLNASVGEGTEQVLASAQTYSSVTLSGTPYVFVDRVATYSTERSLGEDGSEFLVQNDGTFELSNVVARMGNADVTWQSNIVITGSLTVVTGRYHLYATNTTIQGGSVCYDTNGTPDDNNVQVSGLSTGPRLFYLGEAVDASSVMTVSQDMHMQESILLSDTSVSNARSLQMLVTANTTCYGNGHSLVFPLYYGQSSPSVVQVSNFMALVFSNVTLDGLYPSAHISLGWYGFFIIGNQSTMKLRQDVTLSSNLPFGTGASGESMTLDLNGNTLILNGNQITLGGANSTLTIKNGTLLGVAGNSLACGSATGKIVLQNVKVGLTGAATFSTGFINIAGECTLSGVPGSAFIYKGSNNLTINSQSSLTILDGITYSHNNAHGLVFQDASSKLVLVGGTLRHPDAAGALLTLSTGTVIVDHKSYLLPGSYGITATNSLSIQVRPGANINVTVGGTSTETASAGLFTHTS